MNAFPLTARERSVVEAAGWLKAAGQTPTVRDIARRLGTRDRRWVGQVCANLASTGHMEPLERRDERAEREPTPEEVREIEERIARTRMRKEFAGELRAGSWMVPEVKGLGSPRRHNRRERA